jgi:hypothetical protein
MKNIIPIIILFICSNILYSQEQMIKNYEDRKNLFSVKPYTLYTEVINQFGEPDNVVGSGFVIIQYKLPDGRILDLNFGRGDKLYVLIEISVQGEIKEIFNCFNPEVSTNYEDKENLFFFFFYALYTEVIKQFGEPDNVVGSGFVIIQYILLDGRKLDLNFGRGDRLYALREISMQGEIKEIFNCFNLK